MAAENEQERTESATPKRREKAREEGHVAKSREVVSASLFLGTLLFLYFAGLHLYAQVIELLRHALSNLETAQVTTEGIYTLFVTYMTQTAWMLLPLFLIVFLLALGTNLLQTGFLFWTKGLTPQFSRINPWGGIQRLFSMQSLNELLKSLLKIGFVGYITYHTITGEVDHFLPMGGWEVEAILEALGQSALRLFIRTAYVLIILAVLDYAFQRWSYEKSLRMTREEIKQEHKEQEGDPQIKSRIRSIMRETARKRMMQEVPKADVVITNPTHLAVALRYNRQEMIAPQVIAKGSGYVAERIKAIAKEHQIPLIENKLVARALYQQVDIGESIPESLYKAVAEILAYVYRLKPSRS
jgi:flagellar biosynthetic protein FlhB